MSVESSRRVDHAETGSHPFDKVFGFDSELQPFGLFSQLPNSRVIAKPLSLLNRPFGEPPLPLLEKGGDVVTPGIRLCRGGELLRLPSFHHVYATLTQGATHRLSQFVLRHQSHRLAEHRVEHSDGVLEKPDASVESVENRCVDRTFDSEVQDCNHLCLLAESVESADSLFDAHRIPRQVVVHQSMAVLLVEPFRADLT